MRPAELEELSHIRPPRSPQKAAAPAPRRPSASPAGRALMVLGAFTFLLSLAGAIGDREPFNTWFYSFAWWSYILFIDGWVNRRKGESLLLSHPGRFTFFAVFSVGLWFLFEALNLRLGNWSYVGLPTERAVRWAGYVLGFATVVPALMETADLLDSADILRGVHLKPPRREAPIGAVSAAAGAAMLALALLWPKTFFPLVWAAFLLLADPLNERLGAPSLISDWREGSPRRAGVLVLAGLLCGIFWEAWNMPAGARWVYHLPGLDRVKIFEMALPGYLGFPLFALEVFSLSSLAIRLWDRSPAFLKPAWLAAGAAFAYAMCGWVDRFTAGLL
jgi:hypothetical protein